MAQQQSDKEKLQFHNLALQAKEILKAHDIETVTDTLAGQLALWCQQAIDLAVAEAIKIHELEQSIERLDIQCSEGNCKNCDGKRPLLKELQEKLAQLQQKGEAKCNR